MYTILVTDSNHLRTTTRTTIMQRTTGIDVIHFLVNPTYKNGDTTYDMMDFEAVVEYLLPISKTYVAEPLTFVTDDYNGRGKIEYKLPVNSRFTSEAGEIELDVVFTYLDRNKVEHVRRTDSAHVLIQRTNNWSNYVSSTDLDALTQKMLAAQEKISEVADLKLTEDLLQVTFDGEAVGDGVKIVVAPEPDEDIDGNNDGILDLDETDDDVINMRSQAGFIEL